MHVKTLSLLVAETEFIALDMGNELTGAKLTWSAITTRSLKPERDAARIIRSPRGRTNGQTPIASIIRTAGKCSSRSDLCVRLALIELTPVPGPVDAKEDWARDGAKGILKDFNKSSSWRSVKSVSSNSIRGSTARRRKDLPSVIWTTGATRLSGYWWCWVDRQGKTIGEI